MDLKSVVAVFGTVFLAELGDKTQLATLLFAAKNPQAKWLVFTAAATALILAGGLGALAGGFIAQHVNIRVLTRVAGVGFVLIGAWTCGAADLLLLRRKSLIHRGFPAPRICQAPGAHVRSRAVRTLIMLPAGVRVSSSFEASRPAASSS